MRVLQPLPHAADWFRCFDFVQLNEDEMRQLSADPLTLSAQALDAGVSLLAVTLGPKGVAYVAAPGFNGLAGRRGSGAAGQQQGSLSVRTALIPAPAIETIDPTGCGDVFGAAAFARLLAGDAVEPALRHATTLAARNAGFRGATGLASHLRGELVTP